MLSGKVECTFLLLNFQTIAMSNSSTSSLLEIFSFLIPLPEVSLTKNLYIVEASLR